MGHGSRRRLLTAVGVLAGSLVGALALGASPVGAEHTSRNGREAVHLVTLAGPGVAGYRGPLPEAAFRSRLLQEQDTVLEALGDVRPLYRWTTALTGFAVELTPDEADRLRGDPRVALVEENSVRPLAGSSTSASRTLSPSGSRGGDGTVVGVVDTGLWPESSLFAPTAGLGRPPRHFRGPCVLAAEPDQDFCNGKLVGGRWFVAGFGAHHVRSSSSLSPRDDSGHGTQMASIAAGNAGVSVELPDQSLGTYGGVAPRARIAVYKACWTAPDPADDGCATADLVTAIDHATRDGVDVLNLSVGGPPEIDTVERALLGAAERGIVVVGAAGNLGADGFAAHPSPWVTTVGGVTGEQRRGRVELPGRTPLTGAMAASRTVGPARVVVAAEAAAPHATRTEARRCLPGSLDASRTRGAIVLCERGGLARVAKSATVASADGIGMVLANVRPGAVEADLHDVPTVHLALADARALARWSVRHPRTDVTLVAEGLRTRTARVTPWSSGGDPSAPVVKPDLVAPAVGLLGAVPPAVRGSRWDIVSGTSAATAWTSGMALRLLARHDWTADQVRSALLTTARSVTGRAPVLREGAGLPQPDDAARPALAYLVGRGDYRAWLERSLATERLNTPGVQLDDHRTSAVRSVTNVGPRAATFTGRVTGFEGHQVTVVPSVLTLAPGESATFRVRIAGEHHAAPIDDGWLTWRRTDGTASRIPVVLTR